MATSETTKLKLKLLVDKTANKVLFAEVEKEFVDILFNLFYMPFGSFTRHLVNPGMAARNLYQSFESLDEAYLYPNQNKTALLIPFSKWEKAFELLQPQGPQPIERITPGPFGNTFKNIVGFVKFSTYMVTDDLSVTPASMISAIGLLQSKVKDIGAVENLVVEIGPNQVQEILKASIQSDAALTAVFLNDEPATKKRQPSV